ncbi:fatty acid desaturase family protein [Sphingomonas sp. PL-96]|uniref:fatty acid desaturase family protein n=1 Tax=Sphingomonas sp. PL-96 TaxID=2887201 RepID=UPI001E5F6B1D|nr:fatty acid desaturase family protein [Sphingomonas sp. PL-96]MCC2976247.1 fatty acid desaturase family protein [Sphingomonas sp. PL-96]
MPVIDFLLLVAAKLLLGWLIADFLGGVLHWLEDRILREDMLLIGPAIVAPNRLHHRKPMAFAAASLVHRNGTTWIAAASASALWLLAFGPSAVWAGATLGGMLTSMVHYLTHVPPRPGHPLRILQEIGIIQSVAQHAQHHRPTANRRYCVLTSWLNPVLDAVGIWAGLEVAARWLRVPVDAS